MRCALVNRQTNIVANIIKADYANDPAPEGHQLVFFADSTAVRLGWTHTGGNDFEPPEDEKAELATRAAAIDTEAFSTDDQSGAGAPPDFGGTPFTKQPPLVYSTDAGRVSFRDQGQGLYLCSIDTADDATGAERIALIQEAFEAAFTQTDATLIRGAVEKTNSAMIALIPSMHGTYRAGSTDDAHIYHLSAAKWAQAIGVGRARAKLNAAGKRGKADKLPAAAAAATLKKGRLP